MIPLKCRTQEEITSKKRGFIIRRQTIPKLPHDFADTYCKQNRNLNAFRNFHKYMPSRKQVGNF